MSQITVKNIPDDLYELLRASARRNRRSINQEIIHCLDRMLTIRPVNVEERLARMRVLREQAGLYVTSNDELTASKRAGLP
jgi:plasmid stability protein